MKKIRREKHTKNENVNREEGRRKTIEVRAVERKAKNNTPADPTKPPASTTTTTRLNSYSIFVHIDTQKTKKNRNSLNCESCVERDGVLLRLVPKDKIKQLHS
mmetsp:Transcript_6916/g.9203  ORF Transcript_6916/g.9203 Transcript_6916/m.9203 type:complete len:103 (-) Transcript_6916:51-359(-)